MVSTVRAEVREGLGAMDVLRALFPCGSITGAPKIRAMELIDELEPNARGPYCGAIGRIGPREHGPEDGTEDAAFNVAIRTIRLTPGENERHQAVLGVGGAIVADSEGLAEWRECLVKGGFARGAAGGHDLIETMRVEPGAGVTHLAWHLDRMEASAAELGFAFDRALVETRMRQLCAGLSEPAKLRLLLSRGGEVALETGPLPPSLADVVPCMAVPLPVVPGDWRLRHKTSDRHFYEEALEVARAGGAMEAVLVRPDGLVTEGCFTNIYVEREGILLTPAATLGLLPGVGRRVLIEEGRAMEAELTLHDLSDGFWIGNALRGLSRARLVA
jgi:para-aminobenzoate synthetase/4-amino-4-deoxychorismate lyase